MTREFARYLVAGGCVFLLDYAGLFILTEYAGVHYLIAASVAFAVGVAVMYLMSVSWVFSHRTCANRLQEFSLFAAVGVVGLIVNAIVIGALTEIVGLHYLFSKVVAAGVILMFNFIVRRALLFSPGYSEQST